MSDPKLQALNDLARRIQRTDNAREARELATKPRIDTEEFVRERRSAAAQVGSEPLARQSFE